MQRHITQKDGASNSARPAVCPTVAGSHVSNGWVSDHRAKLRALVDAFGGKPCFVRFDDGRTAILSAEALKFIPIHEGAYS